MNREELAWAAGFFDGEGNFHYCETNKRHRTPMIGFNISNTHYPHLERLQKLLGGNIYPLGGPQRAKNPHWKPCWQLRSGSFETVQAAIAKLWHWLGEEKREAARVALEQYHARRQEKYG